MTGQPQRRARPGKLDDERAPLNGGDASDSEIRIEAMDQVVADRPDRHGGIGSYHRQFRELRDRSAWRDRGALHYARRMCRAIDAGAAASV